MPESGAVNSELMTLRDAARYLSCHSVTLQRLLAKRAIRAFRFGRAWRFRRSDLDEWIKDRTVVVTFETKRRPRGPKPKHG
jgi:excisionase family DNA binding protein